MHCKELRKVVCLRPGEMKYRDVRDEHADDRDRSDVALVFARSTKPNRIKRHISYEVCTECASVLHCACARLETQITALCGI